MTAEQEPGRIGVQAAPITQAIHAGTLDVAGRMFTYKEDVTSLVLRAVADYVAKHFADHGEFMFTDGLVMEVKVSR